METTTYWLSFKSNTFYPTDLLGIIAKDLGVKKVFITSGTHKTIRYTDKAFKALGPELAKRLYVEIFERLDQYKNPAGNSFAFVVPGQGRVPQNIVWRFESGQEPPPELFNELLGHPNFVFAYAEDNKTPEKGKIVTNARLAIGWKAWFGNEIQQYFPRELLTSFGKAHSIIEHPDGVIAVQLFENPAGALKEPANRDIQTAFRQHIGMDSVIKTFEDEMRQLWSASREVSPAAAPTTAPAVPSPPTPVASPAAPPDSDTPDKPISFGYKTSWIAVQTDNPEPITRYFPGLSFIESSWRDADKGRIFISPSVNGWVFIKGDIPTTDEPKGIKEIEKLLADLSAVFSAATFFGSHRGVDYYSWVYAKNGKIIRAYSEADGELLLDTGEKHGIEKEFIYPREAAAIEDSFQQDIPDEDMVLKIAADWSLDPTSLEEYEASGLGWRS